jgi:DNA-binding transcriptional LysR family regulator
MELRQLRYFLAIAEAGSITAAAEALHMAQPPLSQQLKQLEEELNATLVERGSRHIRLTDAGVLFRNRAEEILDLAQSAKRELIDCTMGLCGTLTLGTVSSSGLPNDNVKAFHERYPDISYEIHEGNTYQVLDLLRKGVVEVGIVRTPFDAVDLKCRFLKSESMSAIFSVDGPFVGKERLSIADLRGVPLIFYRRFERFIIEECEAAGFEPLVACRTDDARTTVNWARSGFGVGLVPETALAREAAGLKRLSIENEGLRSTLTAITVGDRYLSTVARRFFEEFGAGA